MLSMIIRNQPMAAAFRRIVLGDFDADLPRAYRTMLAENTVTQE